MTYTFGNMDAPNSLTLAWEWLEEVIAGMPVDLILGQLPQPERSAGGPATVDELFGERLDAILTDGLAACTVNDWGNLMRNHALICEPQAVVNLRAPLDSVWTLLIEEHADVQAWSGDRVLVC